MLIILLALLSKVVVIPCDAFTSFHINNSPWKWTNFHHTPPTLIKAASSDDDIIVNTVTTTYETTLIADRGTQQSSRLSWLRRILRNNSNAQNAKKTTRFTYDYDEVVIGNAPTSATTTAIMMIHPIGVGIGKWYHDRVLRSLGENYGDIEHRLVFLSPDLLGSATASGPVDKNRDPVRKLPLLNVTDWTEQVTRLMAHYEAKSEDAGHAIGGWSVVANGGCAPIAIAVASASLRKDAPFSSAVTNVVISSPPRLPFFLEGTDPAKVRKSYRTLSGVAGRLFWWYSLRKNGRFVQKFSERNLVGDAANLGEEWTPNCVAAARLNGGRSQYSTFAFLAGALQDGCSESLDELKGSDVMIDFIRGSDKRRNRAKSWFWTRKAKANDASTDTEINANENHPPVEETIQQYVNKNGNRGKELFIGGRISLAWEDSDGYAKSLMDLLCE